SFFFFSSRRRHTRFSRDWSSDVCSSDLRLFHEDDLRLFDAEPVEFWCTCSEERTMDMLKTLGREELEQLLEEQGAIEVDCQFCHQQYRFGQDVIQRLFGNPTQH